MYDNKTMKLLKCFYRRKRLLAAEIDEITGNETPGWGNEHLRTLLRDDLVAKHHLNSRNDGYGGFNSDSDYYEIKLSGIAYIEQRRRDFFQMWVPYSITTAIAIAALIVSIVK